VLRSAVRNSGGQVLPVHTLEVFDVGSHRSLLRLNWVSTGRGTTLVAYLHPHLPTLHQTLIHHLSSRILHLRLRNSTGGLHRHNLGTAAYTLCEQFPFSASIPYN
jgi:hypothetical protein